jgi:Lon protease-like protein
LPETHKRENITYPQLKGRDRGFYCPFADGEKTAEAVACGAEHVLADCGVDVTLNKAMEIFEKNIRDHAEGDVGQLASEQTGTSEPGSVSSSSWRLAATYMLAEKGELPILADVAASLQRQNEPLSDPDKMILERIKDNLRRQLDCEVCFSLMLEPYTTACGHSFCRSCVARVLDHSNLCPICRRKLPQAAAVRSEPKNARLDSLILRFFPSAHQARLEAAGEDELNSLEDKLNNVPLFICTVSFPTIPTFLHVFEERYQLMLRRALQSGERRFGMVLPDMVPPGGRPFKQYGVMLEITRVERLPTGNSLVNTVGRYKFSVLQNAVLLDGYHTAKVERVDDISLTDEENMELREISSGRSGEEGLDSLPTQKLFEKLQLFVEQRRSEGVPWLHRRRLAAYGQPPSDPAVFPYWLASVLPIPESEKYALLPATSVRERLKIAARWVEKMEKKEW